MTTETTSLPPPAAGECHRGTLLESQEPSQALQVENRDMAKNAVLTTSPDDSWVPPLEGTLISFAEDTVAEEPFTSVWKDGHIDESTLSPLKSSETFKMADNDQGQNGSYFVLQSKTADPFLEQLKAGDTSTLSSQGEDGSDPACRGKTPAAFSKEPNPADTSAQVTEGEEGRPHTTHPAATTDSMKQSQPSDKPNELSQGDKGSPPVHYGDTSGVRSEQQKPDSNISSQQGIGEESWEMDCHGQTPGVAPEFPEQLEVAGGPKGPTCNVENGQDHLLPRSANPLLQETETPRQSLEGSCHVFPGHDPSSASSAEPQGTFDIANISEGLKPGGQEMTDMGEREGVPRGPSHQPGAPGKVLEDLKGQLEEIPEDKSQVWEKLLAQDGECETAGAFQALALTDPQSGVGSYCQQRAAGTGGDTFPEAVAPLSPVATSDSLGPAHGGLAPGGDKEGREGLSAPESQAAGRKSKPLGEVGAESVLESQRGEEATRDPGPEGAIGEPVGAKLLARELPSLESGIGVNPEDPSDAMVLACSEESLDTRHKKDSHNLSCTQYMISSSEQAGSQAKLGGGLLFNSKELADTEDLVNATDAASATPISDELSGAGGPRHSMENDASGPENHCLAIETPIEREIRLHLEREELLRQQRGLASSRGAQEYVEVRVRPILSPSMPPSSLPKEKERQRAGAQMQREIQRECQREEDLVQLGKVRGAYDRGTPQELQEKKMLFEQPATPDPLTPMKTASSNSEGGRERSLAEASSAASPVTPAPGALQQQCLPERAPTSNPFFCLRAKSPQSLLEREVQEAQERERELQRQRHKIYGAALSQQPEEALDLEEEVPFQPERPLCKKLDVTWPPPSPPEPCQVNGLHQLERSPRSRQKSALIQRWESGTVGNQESED